MSSSDSPYRSAPEEGHRGPPPVRCPGSWPDGDNVSTAPPRRRRCGALRRAVGYGSSSRTGERRSPVRRAFPFGATVSKASIPGYTGRRASWGSGTVRGASEQLRCGPGEPRHDVRQTISSARARRRGFRCYHHRVVPPSRDPYHQRFQPEQRQSGGQEVARDRDPEHGDPRARGLHDPGGAPTSENRGEALRGVLDAVVGRRKVRPEDVSDGSREEREDLAPREEGEPGQDDEPNGIVDQLQEREDGRGLGGKGDGHGVVAADVVR